MGSVEPATAAVFTKRFAAQWKLDVFSGLARVEIGSLAGCLA